METLQLLACPLQIFRVLQNEFYEKVFMSDEIKKSKIKGFEGLSSLSTNLGAADVHNQIPEDLSESFNPPLDHFPEKYGYTGENEESVAVGGYNKSKKNVFLAYSTITLALLIFSANSLKFLANVDLIYFSELNFIHHGILLLLVVTIAYFEAKTGKILDKITYPGIIIGLISTGIFDSGNIANHFIAVFGSGIVLVLITYGYNLLTKKSGLGGGIIKLLPMIGAFLGIVGVCLIFIFSFIAAGIIEIFYISIKKEKKIVSCEFGLYICLITVVYTALPFTILIR